MSVRAKFKCVSNTEANQVRLEAVTSGSKENETWSKYTPSGTLTMHIDNAPAKEQFVPGKEYYIDFTPAEA